MMRKLVVVLMVAAFVVGFSGMGLAAGPKVVKLPAKMMGDVTFPHAMHQKIVKDCKTCHHMGVAAGNCSKCHGVKEGVPSAKDAFHKTCKGCHQKENKGPTNCKGCHKK